MVQNNLIVYYDQFREYLHSIQINAYNKHIKEWSDQNPRICRTIINKSKGKLDQQIGVYQKILEKQLNDRVVELRINKRKMDGFVNITSVCHNIKNDQKLNELK